MHTMQEVFDAGLLMSDELKVKSYEEFLIRIINDDITGAMSNKNWKVIVMMMAKKLYNSHL